MRRMNDRIFIHGGTHYVLEAYPKNTYQEFQAFDWLPNA